MNKNFVNECIYASFDILPSLKEVDSWQSGYAAMEGGSCC